MTAPADLSIKLAEQTLTIRWIDGAVTAMPLAKLRRMCPCAACKAEREEAAKNPLAILKADPTNTRAISAKMVGNYAIQLFWSDGHDSGIFDFGMLRTLGEP